MLMECSGDNFFLPTCMTPINNDTTHSLMRAKKLCIERRIKYTQYKEEVVLHTRRKRSSDIYEYYDSTG